MTTATTTAARPADVTKMSDEQLLALPEAARRIPTYAKLIEAAQKRRDSLKVRLSRDLKNREALERAAYATRNDRAAEAHRRSANELRELIATL